MHKTRIAQTAFLLTIVLALAGAQTVERIEREQTDFDPVFSVDEYGASWITGDSDGDGRVDYALYLDESSRKRFEAVDFNGDGLMDDFYVYRGGVLHEEQLDTNFDGTIDLWIFMHDGVRVRGYERDSDYDGTIDLVREFGDS
jgi:hypothetical protein